MTAKSKNNAPVIMGILNVTPDSFSDGGEFMQTETAVAHALTMVKEGAGIIDIGGESSRPGSSRVSPGDQIKRVREIIQACREHLPGAVAISIDTTHAGVAEAALEAGANWINDISAGREDPDILSLVAERNVPYVMMHMQGTPATMQDDPYYDDVTFEVKKFLLGHAEQAIKAGIRTANIILDPGIGFGKTTEHNLQLLKDLDEFVNTGFPVLLGASRKRFMGSVCEETEPKNLVASTCATTALGVMAGVRYFRVHDVKANHQAAAVAWAIKSA